MDLSTQSIDVSPASGVSVAAVAAPIQRKYDAARVDRRNSRRRPLNQSADLELLSSATTIRASVRDLVRNNSYAQGIVRARLRNVVGCGITPQARIASDDGNPDETLNTELEKVWARWQKRADVTGRLSFQQMQRLAFKEVDEAGEVLVQFTESPDRSRPIPLALELIEADRLADDVLFPRGFNPDTGNEVRRGVEIDGSGRAIAYWIYPHPPQDINTLHVQPERRSADNILHLYHQDRVGQTRGVSMFAPVVRRLRDTEFYLENELTSSAVAACFSAVIKTIDGEASGGLLDATDSDATDSDGNTFEYLQPGIVARLMPGEEMDTINPTRLNASSDPWIKLLLRSMGIGTGLSYERLTRDYSQTNYSSNRASDLEDRREFRPLQDWLISSLCEPVWVRFVEAAVIEEVITGITALDLLTNFDHFTEHVWQPPGWEWVDPEKEAKASILSINSNLSTQSAELAKRGLDMRDTFQQRKRENDLMEELGLSTDPDVPGVAANVDGSDEKPEEESETRETANA